MFKNYLHTAIKVLLKNRIYSLINIVGLTLGLCACMIVATVVIDDLSYDKQWSRANDLYRIVTVNKQGEGLYDRFASSFGGLAPELKKSYPEVENYSQLAINDGLTLKINEQSSSVVKVTSLVADTSVWSMLDFKIVDGNPKNYVDGKGNLVISESFRDKYFAGENPVGRVIHDVPTYGDKPAEYLITGVIKDIPSNTHLRADVIRLQKSRVEALNKEEYGSFTQNYLLMRPGVRIQKFQDKVNNWYKGFISKGNRYQFEFQPIKDIYLHSDFATYQNVKGSIQNIYIFSGVAILLLVIACVNFINLSTARATTRLRETGVRKILGAKRSQIIFQFLTESILFFALSSLLAILIYQFALKPVQDYLGHPLAQTFTTHAALLAVSCGIIFLVSVITGIYPAWLISGFKPANSLKGKLFSTTSFGQTWLRKSLVVLQFSISIVVLVAMIIVQQQSRFLETKDVGFNKNNLLSIGSVSWDGKGAAFKNELRRTAGVENVSISSFIPSTGPGFMSREIDDPSHPGSKMTVWYISADVDLAKTLALRTKEGRLLSTDFATDAISEDSIMQLGADKYNKITEQRTCLITETTAKLLHVKELNKLLTNVKAIPVGIVADFHNESFYKSSGPLLIIGDSNPQYGGMLIRTTPGAGKQVMASLQKLWKQFYPEKLLDTNWVDDLLAKQYESERKLKQLFAFFSTLTMLLAALGVFGLIVHAAAQRVKEIGIRKVLGASVSSIVRLLSSDFLKLVVIAIIIASPIAWWTMNKWLQGYAYRITINWWVFAIAGAAALLIALVTVSFQAVKAAVENPVKSLRTE